MIIVSLHNNLYLQNYMQNNLQKHTFQLNYLSISFFIFTGIWTCRFLAIGIIQIVMVKPSYHPRNLEGHFKGPRTTNLIIFSISIFLRPGKMPKFAT